MDSQEFSSLGGVPFQRISNTPTRSEARSGTERSTKQFGRRNTKGALRSLFDSMEGSVLSSEWASRSRNRWASPEEKGEEVDFLSISSANNCLTAKTSFLLPYQWSPLPSDITLTQYVRALCNRTIVSQPDDRRINLWKEKSALPHAIEDLDPRFREIIGWKSKVNKRELEFQYEHDSTYESHLDNESVCRHLILTKEALSFLFPAPTLVAKASDGAAQRNYSLSSSSDSEEGEDIPENIFSKKIAVSRVEITVFPLGSAVMIVTLNWNPKRSISKVSIEELRTWLFLSKFRHKIYDGFQGWRMNEKLSMLPPSNEVQQSLGKHVTSSLFFGVPISISQIGNWMLLMGDEDIDSPPLRLSPYIKHSFHHTVVVLRHQPSDQLRNEYLFHLRRALGQTNRPPLSNNVNDYDIILQHRKNRFLGVSLEGCVSLSWPSTENFASDNFEVKKWHQIFFGVFLILSVHVLGEKSILKEFSHKSSSAATVLKEIIRDDFELDELSGILKELNVLSGLVTCYTMQLSSDECGGHTEYAEFFTALRNVFRIREQRTELEHEIEDILKLVQNDYIEGLIERQDMELTKKTQLRRHDYLKLIRIEKQNTRFTLIAYSVAGTALPFLSIPAIFGSNLYDNGFASFWLVIGITFAISCAVAIMFSMVPYPKKTVLEKEMRRNLDMISFRYLQNRGRDEHGNTNAHDEIVYIPPSRGQSRYG